jgi:Kef-type K+ transport system membrane component KefB
MLRVVLGLAAALVLAVVAAHPAVRRLERRLGLTVLLSSGVPFLVLGVVFRHPSIGVLTDDVVADLRPALEFGLGWLGFVVGMQFDIRELDRLPDKTATVVFLSSALPFAVTALACVVPIVALDPMWTAAIPGPAGSVVAQVLDALDRSALRDAIVLGACAAPAAPVAAVAIARSAGSVAASIVARVTALNDVAGVVVLALVCAFFRPADAMSAWRLPHVAWLFVTLGMGGVLGILTYVLVRTAKGLPEEVAYLLGAVALSAGMAGYLGLSPLVAGAIAGALLTNLPHERMRELRETILQLERPLYLIFLLVAGALWDPTAWQGWLLVPVFVVARVGAKVVGAQIAVRAGPAELPDARTLGLALSPQSPIAIATIVSFATLTIGSHETFVPWMMTAVIGGAVLTELTVQAIARLRGGLRFEMLPPSIPPPAVAPAFPAATRVEGGGTHP